MLPTCMRGIVASSEQVAEGPGGMFPGGGTGHTNVKIDILLPVHTARYLPTGGQSPHRTLNPSDSAS